MKRKMPRDRVAISHEVEISGVHVNIQLGFYEDGKLGEIFLQVAKEGSTLAGMMDAWAIAVSSAIQQGCDPVAFLSQFVGARFEPQGHVDGEYASSIIDYVARYAIERAVIQRWGDWARKGGRLSQSGAPIDWQIGEPQ